MRYRVWHVPIFFLKTPDKGESVMRFLISGQTLIAQL